MFSYELEVKKIDEEYFLYYENEPICIAQGKYKVKSKSEELINFIKDEFERCGEISVKKNNSVNFNNKFCAYAIYSDQIKLIENPKRLEYKNNLPNLFLKYDLCFVRTGIGPPYELEQEVRLRLVHDKIREIVGDENFKKLSKYAWGEYYNGITDGEDPGPGEFISDEDFKNSGITKEIQNIFSKLNNEQKGAVHGLYSMLGKQSILLPILLISGQINTNEYSNAVIGLGNNFPFIYMDSKNKKEEKKRYQEYYDAAYSDASLALNYSSIASENELIIKEESIVHEYKSSLIFSTKENKINKYLVLNPLKTIVAFLNTKGGHLIVGVDDNKKVLGIEIDDFKSRDEWHRFLKDKIRTYIDKNILEQFIKIDFKSIKEKTIAIIKCEPLPVDQHVFLKEKNDHKLFVRQGPATHEIEKKDLINWHKNRKIQNKSD